MDAKYFNWVRARISEHAPNASEPDRVQVLALAAYNLSKGAGTLFGMHWPETGIAEVEQLRDEALDQLGRWFEHLDEHNSVEIARFIAKHSLDVQVPDDIAELLRRLESREGLELPEPPAEDVTRMGRRISSAPTVMKTAWLNVQAAAQSTMLALQRLKWEHEPFLVEPPATAAHLAAIEHELPFQLPDSFVLVMGLWGRTAFFSWTISPDDRPMMPDAVAEVAGGGFELGLWDLGRVLQLRAQCEIWRDIKERAPDSMAYQRWDRALPFAGEEGKYLTLQVTDDPKTAPVVYLNSDEDEARGHGLQLSPSLTEFLVNWANLGFPGEDLVSLAPFWTHDGLSLETDNAQQWRAYLFGDQQV